MSGRETADEIEAAAIRWVWRLDREGRTPELEAELHTWLTARPGRQGAFLQAEAAWAMLDRGQQLAAETPLRLPRGGNVRPRRRTFLMAGGATIAASIAGALNVGLSTVRYGTAVGEIRRVLLKDGSTAAINTQSEVAVDMTGTRRVVKLARGEAWFQVAKNPDRPFIVEAGRVRVWATGTAFSVRRRDGGAEVLVSEGAVEVWVAGAEGHRARVSVGERALVAENAAISEAKTGPSEIDRQLAWRAGSIDLGGETLAEAVAEFNRYNTRKLVVADPKIAEERFYGVFRTDDPEGFAGAVQRSLGVVVSTPGSNEIRISATKD